MQFKIRQTMQKVEAIQYNGDANWAEVSKWCIAHLNGLRDPGLNITRESTLEVRVDDRVMEVRVGEWLIQHEDNVFVMSDDAFKRLFVETYKVDWWWG
jgi:hypothetical protein